MPGITILELGHEAEVRGTRDWPRRIFGLQAKADGEYLIRVHCSYVVFIRREY